MAYPFNSAQRKQSLGRWRGRVRRLATGFRQIPIKMAMSKAITARRTRRQNKFLFEGLEPRLLLSADPLFVAAAANTALDATIQLGTDTAGTVEVQVIDNNNSGAILSRQALVDTTAVVVTGSTLADTFSIDFDATDLILLSLLNDDLLFVFNGGAGDDTLTLPSNDLHISFNAGDGDDTLVGSTQPSVWNVTTDDSGTVANINLPLLDVPTVAFANVETISGVSADDTLSAEGANVWGITAANAVTLGNMSFIGIEKLAGSTVDIFTTEGTETLDYSAWDIGDMSGVTVDLDTAIFTGGFTSVTGFVNVIGSAFDDNITGDEFDNILSGGAGNDIIVGGDGNDTLSGGDGNDSIEGGLGDDEIFGNDGNDTLLGGADNNQVFGGLGNDTVTIDINSRFTTFNGGDGNDTLRF